MRASLLALLLLLAACSGDPAPAGDPADESRLAFLRAEKILGKAEKPTETLAFEISEKLPLERTTLLARIHRNTSASAPADAWSATAAGVGQLQSTGWTVYFAACVPPSANPAPKPTAKPVVPQAEPGTWRFSAYGYKVSAGVSYWASLDGSAADGQSTVLLTLIAPHSKETSADLFPDRPAALDTSCLTSATFPDSESSAGTPSVADDEGPARDSTPKPSGHR